MRQGYQHLIRYASIILTFMLLVPTINAQMAEAWSVDLANTKGAVSDSGGVYVIAPTVYESADAVLYRLRTDGTMHWTRTWDHDQDGVEHLGVDGLGHVYMYVRSYEDSVGNSMVMLCYDSLGTKVWEDWPDVPGQPGGEDWVSWMGVNSSGSIALSGYTYVADFCEWHRSGAFVVGYGPTGSSSRWMHIIEQEDHYVSSPFVAISPTGTVLLPTNRSEVHECETGDCVYDDLGCQATNISHIYQYSSSGNLQNAWAESRDTKMKFFDDGSYCVWESDYNFNGDQALRYYGSDGFVDWNVSLNLTIFQPYKDGLGNVYVIAAWYAPDSSPGAFAPSVSNIYHIMKLSPTGSVLADLVFDEHSNVFAGAVLPDGRFFAVASIGLWPDNEYVLQAYDPNLNIVDDIVLSTGSDTHYIFGQDAEGAIYVRSEGRIRKFETSKRLTIVDINGDPMPNIDFTLSVESTGAPVFNFDTLGTFTTDSEGQLEFDVANATGYTVELHDGTHSINIGDRIRISKHVHEEPRRRGTGTMFNLYLDNARFAANGSMSYDELDGDASQSIIMDHTEIRYNLMVSIEWRASAAYINNLTDGMANLSNYLYDVTDGQVRLDTVTVYSGGDMPGSADIIIKANNLEWAYCANGVGGIFQTFSQVPRQIYMPRKFYGDSTVARNLSYSEGVDNAGVLDVNTPTDYRTKGHEFGHYAFGFYDEYLFWKPHWSGFGGAYASDVSLRCQPRDILNYGFMDSHYANRAGVAQACASEMSSMYRYESSSCRNTKQYRELGRSCWDHLELLFEPMDWGADLLRVPILKPDYDDEDERHDLTTISTFIGPNNDLNNPDYHVGARLVVVNHAATTAPDYANKAIRVSHPSGVAECRVILTNQPNTPGATWVNVQGETSDDGKIWVLGAYTSDLEIIVTKNHRTGSWGIPKAGIGYAPNTSGDWLFGSITDVPDDSAMVEMRTIDGDYSMLVAMTLGETARGLGLLADNPLIALPSLDLMTDGTGLVSYGFTGSPDGYTAAFMDDLGSSGMMAVRAVDASNEPFSFHCPYNAVSLAADSIQGLISINAPGGLAEVMIDTANSSLTEGLMLSSDYPVPVTGVGSSAVQVGPTYTLALWPDISLDSTNQILVRYYDDELLVAGGTLAGDESTLAVYQWDRAGATWVMLESEIDTIGNIIAAPIDSSGIYALFSTQVVSGVDDDGYGTVLPYNFELSQNYPNPFNPVTTIQYSLPERSRVTIEIFNVLGRRVRTLVNREESVGSYTITWNGVDTSGESVATGVYLYRFQAGEYVETKKMLLLK